MMNGQNRAFWTWRNTVIAQVRFKPDRPAIERELTAHYEDHYRDLERIGYPPELAAKRALGAMGDAAEIGKALDKAHKPWLGWMWQASRWLLATLAAAVLLLGFFDRGEWTLLRRTQAQLAWTDPPAWAEQVEVNGSTLYLAPGEIAEADGQIQADLLIWLEMRSLSDLGPHGLFGGLEFRDDRGVIPVRSRNEDGTWPEVGFREYVNGTDVSWTRYQWTVRLHLDHRPKWAEVTYPYDGQDWALRVEWRDGT